MYWTKVFFPFHLLLPMVPIWMYTFYLPYLYAVFCTYAEKDLRWKVREEKHNTPKLQENVTEKILYLDCLVHETILLEIKLD